MNNVIEIKKAIDAKATNDRMVKAYDLAKTVCCGADKRYMAKAHKAEQAKRDAYSKQIKRDRIVRAKAASIERRETEAMLLSITALAAIGVSVICLFLGGCL